jgi:hypothetical protein
VDTHADVHIAAAVDAEGGVLGVGSFVTTHRWLPTFLCSCAPADRCDLRREPQLRPRKLMALAAVERGFEHHDFMFPSRPVVG